MDTVATMQQENDSFDGASEESIYAAGSVKKGHAGNLNHSSDEPARVPLKPRIRDRQSSPLHSYTAPTAGSRAKERVSSLTKPTSNNPQQQALPASSRLLAPTAASKSRASATHSAESKPAIRGGRAGSRASAPPTISHSTKSVHWTPNTSAAPSFAAPTASSLKASVRTTSNAPAVVAPKSASQSLWKPKPAVTAREKAGRIVQDFSASQNSPSGRDATKTQEKNSALEIAAAGAADKAAKQELESAQITFVEKQRIEELTAEVHDTRKKLAAANSVIEQEADRITSLKSKYGGYENTITILENSIASKDAEIRQHLAELQALKAAQNTEASELRSAIEAMREQHNSEIAAINLKLSGAENKSRNLERELEGNGKVIESLEDELRAKEEEKRVALEAQAQSYAGWKEKAYVESLEGQIAALQLAASKQVNEIAELRDAAARSQLERMGKTEDLTALEMKNEMLTEMLSNVQNEMKALTITNKELEAKISSMMESLETANHEKHAAETALLELKKENKIQEKSVADAHRKIFGDLEQNVEQLSAELKR